MTDVRFPNDYLRKELWLNYKMAFLFMSGGFRYTLCGVIVAAHFLGRKHISSFNSTACITK